MSHGWLWVTKTAVKGDYCICALFIPVLKRSSLNLEITGDVRKTSCKFVTLVELLLHLLILVSKGKDGNANGRGIEIGALIDWYRGSFIFRVH